MKQTILRRSAVILAILLMGFTALAQNRPLSGKVVDQNGEPIVGASIMVVGNSTIGTVTNVDGNYNLNVPAQASVTVSCIGYSSQTVSVAGRPVINFTLEEDTEFLEETVVIGYGVQRKSDLTGSVASVRSAELQDRSTSDAAAALQGKAAGVQIFNASGAPGSSSSIRVRGISTNGSSGLSPLFIVDGLKVSNIDYLDPSMIESMEVLKDAASAAIYGAQAGNGVVLITTRNGSKSRDGQVFYQLKITRNDLGRYAKVMDADQYIDWQTQAQAMPGFSRDFIIKNGFWDGKTITNWADEVYAPSYNWSHTVGAQGGNDRGSYFLSLNYTDQDGLVKGKKDFYKRLTAQINADYKIKSWFTVGTNTSIEKYSRGSVSEHSEYSNGSNGTSILGTLIIDPLTPVIYLSEDQMPGDMRIKAHDGIHTVHQNEDGYYYATSILQQGDGGNPLVFRDRNRDTNEGINIRGTIYANITPFKGLVYTSRLGYRIGQTYSSSYSDPYYLNPKLYSDTYSISANSSQNYYYQWENFANYNRTFGKHDIGIMAGMSYTFSDNRGVNAGLSGTDPLKGYAENFRYITQDNGSGTKSIGGGTPNQSSQISYFGRLTYSYDNRYSLQTNFRADAFDSSKLSKQNRWGYFPSVSAGWTISNEPFFKDNVSRNAISFMKVRASWGQNGNIAVLSGYPYSTTISYNSQNYQWDVIDNTLVLGSVPSGLANPNLKWETSEQLDLGLDARFLDNRLTFGVDWFDKKTKDLLMSVSPAYEVGAGNTTINAGSIRNSGLEFELGWQDTVGDLHYSINANFSTLSNMVTYMDKSAAERIGGTSFSNLKMMPYYEEGYSVWYMRGFEYAGVGSDGKAEFINSEGQRTSTVNDGDMTYLGNTLPTYNYGLTFRLDWKFFDFTLFGTGAGGNVIMPCVYRTEHPLINSLSYFYEHAGKELPSINNIYDNVQFWSSSANLFKGDYFKIKQIQLGFTMPNQWAKRVKMNSLRAYVSFDDWFVFTKYPGFDPETASTGSYNGMGMDKGSFPPAKKVLFGLNISF